jgi:hypothetical protein
VNRILSPFSGRFPGPVPRPRCPDDELAGPDQHKLRFVELATVAAAVFDNLSPERVDYLSLGRTGKTERK